MRIPAVIWILLLVSPLFAQEQKDPYYLQQAPVQQMILDCYQHHLEEGLSAQKQGDCRLALRWFRDAKSCPEAIKIPGRMEELERLIAACESKKDKAGSTQTASARSNAGPITGAAADAFAGEGRRRFQPSRAFLTFDKPECFDITCKEAERAFRGGYWDDAAALYRAAKNCTDADQADRQAANLRIEACRAASQDELRRKEQEAVRQARHALAANRANDATQLLRTFDRSLAYRLADFANEYIAPDDNDACRQAMFDALYYAPSVHSGIADENMRIPFCYQLGDNLDRDLQVHFWGAPDKRKICAFAKSRHLLFQWDAETFEPEEPISLEDTTLLQCDVVPDNRTLLFLSKNTYLFWRSPRETYRLPVQAVSLYCFDEKGRVFYFLNATDMKIYALNLRDIFAQRKGSGQRAAPQPTGLGVDYGLLRLAYAKGRFWAGYRDSLTVFAQGAEQGTWQREQLLHFQNPVRNYYYTNDQPYLWLKPEANAAIFANDSAAYFYSLPEKESGVIQIAVTLPGFPIAVSEDARMVATYSISPDNEKDSRLYLFDTESGALKYAALIPTIQTDMHLKTGVFSPDSRQFATTTGGGRLEVWTLDDGPNQRVSQLGRDAYFALNSDGTRLYAWRNDSLVLMPADNPGRVLQSVPALQNSATGFVAGQNWLAYRTGIDSIILTNQLGSRLWQVQSPPGFNVEIAATFNPDETRVAYLAGSDSVIIRSLEDGRLIAARGFGGAIHQIYFVPGNEEVMVVQRVETEDSGNEQTVVKLWSPLPEAGTKLRTVRLHDYATVEVAFASANGLMAFTDGMDIRVFRQNDLLNEATRIRQYGLRMVTALAFHPDGTMLAAGYDDGSVVFWDINTGQARFNWAKPPIRNNVDFPPVIRMRFAKDGRQLQMLLFGYVLLTRDVALSLVRAGVQTDYRKLISFLPNQIREYNLEQALDYPNNFSRLAASGDLPLIRSFFDYYRESAVYSNNIQRVSNYCNRAFILFGQLDAATQKVLRPILLEMYEDYHWKLLLRGQADDADKVANSMIRDFGHPISATLAAAHSALLRDDQPTAARLYAEWGLRSADQGGNDGVIQQSALDSLHTKVRQLMEYDLLKAGQLECLCDLFGFFPSYETLCADVPSGTAFAHLDAVTLLRWDIFRRLNFAAWIKNNALKVQVLEKALENVRQLQRQNRTAARKELEKVTLVLSQAYADWAAFEQGNARSRRLYNRAITELNAPGTFESPSREISRLTKLASYQLNIGIAQLNADQLTEAQKSFQQGLAAADRLWQLLGPDSARVRVLRDEIYAGLYTQLGTTALLSGDAASAQKSFDQARNISTKGINYLFFGHVALLEDDEVSALLNYGDIYNEEILALALFDIERMAHRLPAQKNRMLAFAARLRSARLATNHQLDSTLADYYLAEQKRQYFANREQWDSTLVWNGYARQLAEQALAQSKIPEYWKSKWLDAVLNQTYYLLFQKGNDTARLSQIFRWAQQADLYPDEGDFYYENRYLFNTNLAHAYWLRQKPGDRELAIQHYQAFLKNNLGSFDPWELLLKDFRDLNSAGIKMPDLQILLQQIRPPDVIISKEDRAELGILTPEEK